MEKNDCIRIIVAEDESLILKNIMKKIEQVSPDFVIVGSAYNGRDALSMIDTLQPNILFTDIRMPNMDGLELIRLTRLKAPHVQIVIVSGYEDFEYARKAIQYGVVDYLTKPLKMNLLTDTLLKLRTEILAKRQSVQRTIITSQLAGSNTPSQLPSGFAENNFIIVLLCIGNLQSSPACYPDRSSEQPPACEAAFSDIINTCIPTTQNWWLIDEKIVNQKFLILSTDSQDEEEIPALASRLITSAGLLSAPALLTVAIPEHFITFSEIWKTAQNLRTFLYRGLVIGHARLITEDTIRNTDVPTMDILYTNKFRTFANSGNICAFIRLLNTLFQEFENCCCPQYLIEKAMEELLLILKNILLIPEADYHNLVNDIFEFFWTAHTIPSLLDNIVPAIEDIFDKYLQQSPEILTILNELETHLQRNYTEYINLDELAKRYGFNASYLTRNFKKYKGESPLKYILRLRIDEAKRLLLGHPELSVREISELVGYPDQHYFSRLFKDMTGVSPSDYRYSL